MFGTIIREQLSNVIMESDSLIVIQAISGDSKRHTQICILITDITVLAKQVNNIKFMYCHKSANMLADKIVKRAHMYSNCLFF